MSLMIQIVRRAHMLTTNRLSTGHSGSALSLISNGFKLFNEPSRSLNNITYQSPFRMADADKNKAGRPKRLGKSKNETQDTLVPVDSTQSHSPAVTLKRKRVYDSLEHCRATRSKSKSKNPAAEQSTTEQSVDENEDVATIDFVDSLRSRSQSKSGRFHDTSIDGKSTNMKITTWNINGLRSWLSKRCGLTFIAEDDADIYCFQETKCGNNKVPAEIKQVQGYECFWNGSDDGHSGVVCFSKKTPINVNYGMGLEVFDKEARMITMEFENFYVVNVYVPNSGRGLVRLDFRMKWDSEFQSYLKTLDSKKPVILCGDLNVSHHEIDLANPKTNLKTAGFTIGERNNFTKMLDTLDFIDVFRYLNPSKSHCYTFWTYMRNAREKNIGWRLDYFICSKRWTKKICDCIIRNDVQGSDHCPVSLYMAI